MATEQILSTLTINKVDSEETFNKMKAAGMVNDDELYLTPEGVAGTEEQITVSETEPANSVENDLWLDLATTPTSVEYLPISGGTLTGPLAMSNNKITGVSDPTSAQDVATKNYIDTSFLPLSGGTINGDIDLNSNNISNLSQLSFASTANSLVKLRSNNSKSLAIYTDDGSFGQLYINTIQTNQSQAVSKGYVDGHFQKIQWYSQDTGTVNLILKADGDYTMTNVASLRLTAGSGSCHGFITFGSSTPTVTLTGFTKVDGDITSAAASTVWEFSCYDKYIIFKNWSEV